jgi:hypothetical protein
MKPTQAMLHILRKREVHRCIFTSDLGRQECGFGTLVCTCGMLKLYQTPVEVIR